MTKDAPTVATEELTKPQKNAHCFQAKNNTAIGTTTLNLNKAIPMTIPAPIGQLRFSSSKATSSKESNSTESWPCRRARQIGKNPTTRNGTNHLHRRRRHAAICCRSTTQKPVRPRLTTKKIQNATRYEKIDNGAKSTSSNARCVIGRRKCRPLRIGTRASSVSCCLL